MSGNSFNQFGSSFSSAGATPRGSAASPWNRNYQSASFGGQSGFLNSAGGRSGFGSAGGGWGNRRSGWAEGLPCLWIGLAAALILATAITLGVAFRADARLQEAEKRTVRELLNWVDDSAGTVSTVDKLLNTLYCGSFHANTLGRLGGLGIYVEYDLARGAKVLRGGAVVTGGEDTGGFDFEYSADRSVVQFSVPGDSYDVYGFKYQEFSGFLKQLSSEGKLAGLELLQNYRFDSSFFNRKQMNLERAVSDWTKSLLDGCEVQRLDKRPLTVSGQIRSCTVYAVQFKRTSLQSLFQGNVFQSFKAALQQFSPSFRCYVDERNELIGIDCTVLGIPYELYLEGGDNPWSRIRVLRGGTLLYSGGTETDARQASLYLRDESGELVRISFDRSGGGFCIRTRDMGVLLEGNLTEKDDSIQLETELNLPGAPAVRLTVSKLTERPAMLANRYRRVSDLNTSDLLRIIRASGLRSLAETAVQAEAVYSGLGG